MAVVISTEENRYFSSSGLRRSHSQPTFVTKPSSFHPPSSANARIGDVFQQHHQHPQPHQHHQNQHHQHHRPPSKSYGDSAPSSVTASPTIHPDSTDRSCSSTPASSFSAFASDCDDPLQFDTASPEGPLVLAQFEDVGFFQPPEDLEPPPSPKTGDSYTASPADHDTSTNTSRPESPGPYDKADDDTAIRALPSRHVDYLSHNWREEDIWESWKYIISRRSDYSNAARLENASWRTWMKSKNKLKTVSPETLNWLKDCDVTWLYGPLQTGTNDLEQSQTESSSTRLSKSNSFIAKKPILKKRSMSEIMLQRSLSASSLLKQAAAAVQAQEKDGGERRPSRPRIVRAATDYITFPFSSRRMSRENTSLVPSAASSGIASPSGERKHIHFNEQVEQCIAVDAKGEEDEDEEDTEMDRYGSDSDSDDGAIMMKRTATKLRRPTLKRSKSSASTTGESKTIAMLPSTTLKYREDTPEPAETAMKHSTGVYRSPVMSPSSSQETLRPSRPSGRLFIADGDDGDDEDGDDDGVRDEDADDEDDVLGAGWRSPNKHKVASGSSGLQRSSSSGSLAAEPAGMRRTESGMFMPYEDGEAGAASDGLIGRVIDTVNTAKDIAHVIWNVGWRK